MLSRLGFPAIGGHRRFVTAIGIDAIGSGVWMPLSVLYFLKLTPLSLVEVGLALSIASALSMPFSLAVGQLVDRFGAKAVLQAGNLMQAVAFAAYPVAKSLPVVAAVVGVAALGRTAFWGAYAPMVTAISGPGERERWFGLLSALRNAGFGIGGLMASLALAVGTTWAYQGVVAANAASYVVALVLMVAVPGGSPAGVTASMGGGWATVLRDRGYRWLVLTNFGYAMAEMTLTFAMPVYFVQLLHLPGWVTGAVFIINTLMIGIGQGLVVSAMTGAVRSRIILAAASFTAVSFGLMYAAGWFSVVAAVIVVLVAAVVYTLGEMVAGPVLGALAVEAPPPHLRGRYQSTVQLSWNASSAIAPVLFAWLAARGSAPLWGGLVVLAALWAGCCVPLRRRLPLASLPVTNSPPVAKDPTSFSAER